ncbi:MAG: redoxin domain-containing protein, partial [Verrucomicrobiae bacterium]|nr:redoxin domain-containing protein [Verrucomicrobiae bacterium]
TIFTGTVTVCAFGPKDVPEGFTTLEIGDSAPWFSLPGVDGKTYTLDDFKKPSVLMVLFTGTHCPTSHGIEERLQTLLDDLKNEDFGIVAINPNHSDGLRADEFGYTDYDETFEDSRRYAKDLGWKFPFLYDGYEQVAARAYGCLATPHVFIFDKDRKLRYNGRFDDSRYKDPATVQHPDARNAIEAMLAGKPVPVEVTRPHGCSTKWRERKEHVKEVDAKMAGVEARIEDIDAKGVAALVKNTEGKMRLINVWATWCAPCVEEFPDLVDIGVKFSMRDFELVTISLDSLSMKERARQFLNKQRAVPSNRIQKTLEEAGRATNNYIYTGASIDDLAEALDPDWPGPIPFSILVDKDGKVVYRKLGKVDAEEVRLKVLESMGNYWEDPKEG